MTPELIKQWAKESGFQERQDGFRDSGDPSHYFDCWPEELEAFAALVAAHQRELDAKVCEDDVRSWSYAGSITREECAAAIRGTK